MKFDALPFVVGVTGHRDLPADAEGRLRERFGEVLDRMRTRYPAMPQLVLSGLAAGADIMAAEVALERGIDVVACLPMPQEEYEDDFSPDELQRFRRVLARCAEVVVAASKDPAHKYVGAAEYISYYCDVLVAFWDGLEGKGPGGTADVVQMRRTGQLSKIGDSLIKYIPDIGPVFQIVTPRMGQPTPDGCFSIHEIYPERSGWSTRTKKAKRKAGEMEFDRTIGHLVRFNRDIASEPATGTHEPLAGWWHRTDAVANRMQQWIYFSLVSLYIAAALAGAAQVAVPPSGWFHLPSAVWRIGFLALAYLVFAFAKRGDYENRYQDYRAIAEALRVQHSWCKAGLCDHLVEASYLQMQQNELQWIRLALRTVYLITGGGKSAPSDPSHKDGRAWIATQMEYYERAGKREQRKAAQSTAAIVGVAAAGAVLSTAAGILAATVSGVHVDVHLSVLNIHWPAAGAFRWPALGPAQRSIVLGDLPYWETMPVALGSVLALMIRFYAQQRGFAESARRYQHMFTVFDAARKRLHERVGDPAEVLLALGHEALSEHAEWLILHRERPLTFVHT